MTLRTDTDADTDFGRGSGKDIEDVIAGADFSDCLLLNTVKTARLMMRRFDGLVRDYGVSIVQFSVLMTIRQKKGLSIRELADEIAMDRTTLTRNIDLLVTRGLVVKEPLGAGNGKGCKLKPAGDALLVELIPLLGRAKAELRAKIGEPAASAYLATLRQMSRGDAQD